MGSSPTQPPTPSPQPARRHPLALAALVLGVLALGLNIGVYAWYREPPPLISWLSGAPGAAAPEQQSGVTLHVLGVRVQLGGAEPDDPAVAARRAADARKRQVLRRTELAALGLALAGGLLAVVSWRSEPDRNWAIAALVVCGGAVTWQYVLVGVALLLTALVLGAFVGGCG